MVGFGAVYDTFGEMEGYCIMMDVGCMKEGLVCHVYIDLSCMI